METEAMYFYFLSWVCWIIVTFMMQKSALRTFSSIVLLLIIIGSTSNFSIFSFEVSGSFIVLIIAAIILLVKTLKENYFLHYFSITTISLAYVCFIIYEIFDPVWILINRTWILAFIMVYLTLLLFKKRDERFVFMLCGLIQGELLNSFVLNSVFSYSVMGEISFLAVLFLASAGLGVWLLFATITVHLDSVIQKRVKERQG
ncbi:YphA family membrane protein [Sutcliffiella rhizosphaerae]|uniref:NADH dehydrogenase subunit 6 n=1 Tax=Sutcliffiella rhizosphaerae TaxID=2880967 RepID=A0ABM8YUD3_9BACI|nr:hypothetical protein [Sutcliffiella rhizosphaerae]CAG9623598.1 hypothetical protein BACCIP111883_04416 [Sutcliffiella rhizosphaerae]